MLKHRINIFGIQIDPLTMAEAVEVILGWVREKSGCHYVVTPNVDHIVKLQERPDFRAAYQGAALVLVDGNPVKWAARLLDSPLPEVVPGSDLVPALFSAAKTSGGMRVFLLGAADGVAARAATCIHEQWPWVEVCGTYSPPLGFESEGAECDRILQMISAARPDILVLGLGAPKQELWAHQYYERINAPAVLCVGATIDFLAGQKKRAPLWMRKFCLEWLFRMLSEPRRLSGRYLRDAWIFPRLVIAELLKQKR
jgi:N-acetylglucosaminyldiphosphoundecaprenol N-acetyl-beta-D-mannosaminyltransferase